LLQKFEKGNENFALNGQVRIPGQKTKVSSAEELLKCWSLLSNAGHAQYTYGVERSLFNFARTNNDFKNQLVNAFPPKLKQWSLNAINEYRDSAFHYILILVRISYLPARSRVKAKLYRILSALLLPFDQLGFSDSVDKYKLFRLRRLFDQVRLLCIVTLDSYYSHHPVRYQLSGALMNIGALMTEVEEKSEFTLLMEQTAGWLADEIYFHPRAIAAQKYYEIMSATKLDKVYKSRIHSETEFKDFYLNFMQNGFGAPKIDQLQSLARLTFPYVRFGSIFGRDEFSLVKTLESQLSNAITTHVAVLYNSYTKNFHVDLFYHGKKAKNSCIADIVLRTFTWLARLIEAESLRRIRAIQLPSEVSEDVIEKLRERYLHELVDRSYPSLKSLFNGIIKYLLPSDYIGSMSEVLPNEGCRAIGAKINYVKGGKYDSFSKAIDHLIDDNPNACTEDRLHELKTLKHYVGRSKSSFLLACNEKFIVYDMQGNHVDDWDGMILEVFEDKVLFSIIEAKNLRSKAKSENQAFKQLAKTREILYKKQKIKSRRKRIIGMGAVVSLSFD
jgi:hypothetical protein